MAEWELNETQEHTTSMKNGLDLLLIRIPDLNDPNTPGRNYTKMKEGDFLNINPVVDGVQKPDKKERFGLSFMHYYKTLDELLEKEDITQLHGIRNKEAARAYYESIPGYMEKIRENGITAIAPKKKPE